MLDTYSPHNGFEIEEITFGNGVPLVIGQGKAPHTAELDAAAELAFEPDLEPPASAILMPAPAAAAPVPEPALAVETEVEASVSGKEKDDDVLAHVAGEMAGQLARILDSGIRGLEKRHRVELDSLRDTVAESQRRLDATGCELEELKHRTGGLLDLVSAHTSAALTNTQKYEELAQGIAALREAGTLQESAIAAATGRLEEVAGFVETQRQDLTSLRPALLELSPQVAAVVERLDRQADAIRSLYEARSQRDAALDQLSDFLEQLKSARAPSVAPAQL